MSEQSLDDQAISRRREERRRIMALIRSLLCGVCTGLTLVAWSAPEWASVGIGVATWLNVYTVLYFCESKERT